nr:FAD dependent oxidoreductase protein [Rhizobium phage RHph_TM26]
MRDVIIVGGGLFGSIAAAALRAAGMDVCLIDDGRPLSGSRAAGCLMKPSWLGKMGKSNVSASFQLLDRLYGLRTVYLKAGPLTVDAEWVNPDRVLGTDRIARKIAKVSTFPGGNRVRFAPDLNHMDAKTVIVACGAWTRELITGTPVVGKVGVSVRLNKPPEDNRISVWAPYKQLVRFAVPDEGFYWAGDGTAILEKRWTPERFQASRERIESFAGAGNARAGIRPFTATDQPASLEEIAPGLFSLTGGGKNGTAAAGWAATQLLERLT